MSRDEIRKLADLAGWTPTQLEMASEAEWARLERFAALVHGYVVHEERDAILSKATTAHAVDGNCAIVLVADIRARGTP